jgi:hypothetical protein
VGPGHVQDDEAHRAGNRAEQSAYDRWLDQTSSREEAGNDRVHAAEGVIPTALWRVLFFSAGLIVLYMLFFADSGERAVAMERTLALVGQARQVLGEDGPLPCDAEGRPR